MASSLNRRVALALLLSAASQARGQESPSHVFPRSGELFHRLLADPRQAQTSLRYYRQDGRDTSDVALGNTWGMRRWHAGKDGAWAAQWDVEGMGYSRFLLSGSVNEFQTIDFFANLPVEIRRGAFSARVTPFHESSHLGDDYIRRTNDQGFRYSIEGVRAVASLEPMETVRLYGGGSYLLHAIPSLGRRAVQAGLELTTPDMRWIRRPCWIYLAQDIQSRSQNRWNVDSSTELGFKIGFHEVVRAMRVHAGYFTGHSPFGQFISRKESHFSLGASFDF